MYVGDDDACHTCANESANTATRFDYRAQVTRYYLSRILMAVFVFMAFRAALWAAVDYSSLTPVLLWVVAAFMAWSLCPESPEEAK